MNSRIVMKKSKERKVRKEKKHVNNEETRVKECPLAE
jgi:hypothetical protein